MSGCSARCRTSSRLGLARPVSTKLRCRADTAASLDRSSWLSRRRCRQPRRRSPTPPAVGAITLMARRYRQRRRPSPTSQVSASPGAVRSGRLDELQIELDLDLVAEDGAGRTPPEAEVLAAQLAGGLEAPGERKSVV